MTSRVLVAFVLAASTAALAAQDDRIFLVDGSKVEGVEVASFDVRNLRYKKGGSTESLASDRVAKLELGEFKDVYRRGLRDADLMLTVAREQLQAKNTLLAQLGFVGAAAQFFDSGRPAEAVAALDEMAKALPEAGTLPEVYRQKFEYSMGLGSKGLPNAVVVAKKYQSEAVGNAWPAGFAVEAEFFQALAERSSVPEFQSKLRNLVTKARGSNPIIANRANVQLAHSLRDNGDPEAARRIYEDVASRDGVDASSRAGAFLGLGKLLLEQAGNDKDVAKQALLMFLRVRLETRDAWPSLQAEALYNAVLAADKWRGPEYSYIMARCRNALLNDFGGSEWAERARR